MGAVRMAKPTYEQLRDIIARQDQQIAQKDHQIGQLEVRVTHLEQSPRS